MERELRDALAARQIKRISDGRFELSAVLVPIYCRDGEGHLVFTKRTERVTVHKGQISFPGGAYSEGDGTLLGTALRESAEELGIAPETVRVLGQLDDIITTSGYIISPYVGIIPWPHQFRVNAAEIQEVIEAPLASLLSVRRRRQETIGGRPRSCYTYRYQEHLIWGATAAILTQLLGVLAGLGS